MTLLEHQRAMRDLIRRGVVADDPYIAAAATSTGLAVTRDTIRNWLSFRLDRNCRLTSTILRQRNRYERALASVGPSAFIEQQTNDFLDAAIACGDPLIASVAEFERAFLNGSEAAVSWPCDPYPVLGALLENEKVPELPAEPCATVIANGSFRLTSLSS